MKSQVEKWLKMAEADLNFAKHGLKQKYYAHVCFLSQQCAEKCLKALSLYKDSMYPKSHKLVDLYEHLKETGTIPEDIKGFLERLKILDEYYIPTRYPDAIPGSLEEGLPTKEDAQEALQTAQDIFSQFKEVLNQ